MIKHKLIYGALAAALATGAAACSDDVAGDISVKGERVPATASGSMAPAGLDSRTERPESTDGTTLAFCWNTQQGGTDRVVLFEQNTSNWLGTMAVTSGFGTANASLTGDLWLDRATTTAVVSYLGNAAEVDADYSSTSHTINTSVQSGLKEDLSQLDVMTATADVVRGESGASVSFKLRSVLAFGKLKLTMPEGVTVSANNPVVITGPKTHASYSLTDGSVSDQSGDEGIRISALDDDNTLYFAFLPGTFAITVSVKSADGSATYSAEIAESTYSANVYYHDGQGHAPELKLADPDAPVDQTNNPLKKWAKGNLICSSAGVNSEVGEGIAGSLYQWGRNHGYSDWQDARGALRSEYHDKSGHNQYIYPYYVVGEDRSGETHTGTDGQIYADGWYFSNAFYITDSKKSEEEQINELKENYELFVMNGSFDNNNGDYWIWSKDGGSDWVSRAKACGYAENSLCSSEWKMPSSNDYREIFPNNISISSSSSLSQINNHAEVRIANDNKTHYAIKWLVDETGMTIKATVVPSTFVESDLESVDWDDQSKVETRKFPFSGAIVAKTATVWCSAIYVDEPFYDYIAGPTPMYGMGTKELHKDVEYSFMGYKYHAYWGVWTYPSTDYAKNCFGAYWTSDAQAFYFSDNARYSGAATEFGINALSKHHAFAVRLIKK